MIKIFLMLLLFSFNVVAETKPIQNIQITKSHKVYTKQEVLWIYSLKTRFWDNGNRITVYHLDFNNPTHIRFVKDVLGVTPLNFQTSVETYINLGTNSSFRKAKSEHDMYFRVANTLGSVGYVSSRILLINDGDKHVKEITIID